jgi:hypothetical protein
MKSIVTLVLIVICGAVFAQKSKVPGMQWRDNPTEEMPAPVSEFSSLDKGKILCYLSNDDNNLFIDMIIPDPGVQKKILDIGLSIWIDPAGKEKKVMGVRFPIGAASVRSMLERKGERATEEEVKLYSQNSALAMAYEIDITGFGEWPMLRVPASGGEGFAASIRYNDDGDLIYRLLIPRDKVAFGESKGQMVPFSLGIEYGSAYVMPRPGGGPGGGGQTTSVSYRVVVGSEIRAVPVGQGGGAMPQGAPGGRGGQGGAGGAGGARPGMAAAPGSSQQAAQPPVWIKALVPATK